MPDQNLSDTDLKIDRAKEDLEDTRSKLSADEKSRMMLKEKCQMTDQKRKEQYETHQRDRKTVSKSLTVLDSNDAHDTSTMAFNHVLLETGSSSQKFPHTLATGLLKAIAERVHSSRLPAIVVRGRLDAFNRVGKLT